MSGGLSHRWVESNRHEERGEDSLHRYLHQ
jgi:hypothetical protein